MTHNCSQVASGDREMTEAMKKKEEVDEKIIKTTLRTPHSLWTIARITALKEGISVQELVTKAIREYVKGGRS
jgi:predicted HicB family RNase H-like nuclease